MSEHKQVSNPDGGSKEKTESVVFPDEESKKATEKAMRLLLHKDRTEWELSDRLYRAGFSEKAAFFAMEYVRSYGYLNDLRYAAAYVDYHKGSKSNREIRQKLKEKHIPDDILTEVMRDMIMEDGSDPEDIALQALLKKRLKGREVSELTFEEKQKQMRYLAGKGYPIEKIKKFM